MKALTSILLLGLALAVAELSPAPETIAADDAKAAEARKVAILVYDGMEILDFAGPGEVFQAAGRAFEVYTVARTKDPIVSQGFVTITPRYTIDDAPAPDILVLPGGGTGAVVKSAETMKWVGDSARKAEIVLTVCTGAFVLAETGLLDGLDATTWHGAVGNFREAYPRTKVHGDTRFVDNGKFVTTAGVSAGIDGALHVVSKLLGEDRARATARYMEYDKWEPSAGLVVKNEINARYRSEAEARADAAARSAVPASLEGNTQVVTIAVTDRGFVPSVVAARPGVPIRFVFDRQTQSRCFDEVQIPALGVKATALAQGAKTTIDVAATKAGTYQFACGMEMFRGSLLVKE